MPADRSNTVYNTCGYVCKSGRTAVGVLVCVWMLEPAAAAAAAAYHTVSSTILYPQPNSDSRKTDHTSPAL